MNVKFIGAFLDFSGYGEAVRHDIGALHKAGVNITTEYVKFAHGTADFGRLGNLGRQLQDRKIDYDIKILHITPNILPKYVEDGKYNIGRVFWETDKLPPDFASGCSYLDEIWTGSETTKKAIENAGVDVPIYIIPEAIDTDFVAQEPFKTDAEGFKFYSIFEWTTRKNPDALIRAYLEEFSSQDNVSLTIKTYVDDFTNKKKNEIIGHIKGIKKQIKNKDLPPIYIYPHLMDRHQIQRFHQTGDCFISCTRGEGWGIPQMEAMLFKKPVITTDAGGITDHLKNERDAIILPMKQVPVNYSSRNAQWYLPEQNWGEVNHVYVRNAMRKVFKDSKLQKRLSTSGHNTVNSLFSLGAVGAKMLLRLKEIKQ